MRFAAMLCFHFFVTGSARFFMPSAQSAMQVPMEEAFPAAGGYHHQSVLRCDIELPVFDYVGELDYQKGGTHYDDVLVAAMKGVDNTVNGLP